MKPLGETSMIKKSRDLGHVSLTQLQPSGLITKESTPSAYKPSRRLNVPHLYITPQGIEADTTEGERVLDVHHRDHPQTRYRGDDDVSIGFTSHYAAMRARFGDHMVEGVGGENIIIDYEEEVWLEDMGEQIAFENPDTGQMALLDVKKFASPCDSFSHFAANCQGERLPADKLKETLQFLGNGRRGFYLVLSEGQERVTVRPGDKVFVVGAG
jgi:hypothetical protein